MKRRSAWLDRARAAAILGVVAYHVVAYYIKQISPGAGPLTANIAYFGRYGVDLFFVLSGWLIGNLFWSEYRRHGDVQLLRFWARRALRTIPPYLVALVISWIAVYSFRSQAFDIGYLVFAQNYYQQIPFFQVSWSLCIEEHFYLIIPVLASALLMVVGMRRATMFLFALFLLPSALRFLEFPNGAIEDFGYLKAATHLRLDGLIGGFYLSFVAVFDPSKLRQITAWALPIALFLIGCAAVAIHAGELAKFTFLPAILALLFCLFVIYGEMENDSKVGPESKLEPAIRAIALMAYSAYLTHPLAIHFTGAYIAIDLGIIELYWPIVTISIFASTVGFWLLIERPSIRLRDSIISRRPAGVPIVHQTQAFGLLDK